MEAVRIGDGADYIIENCSGAGAAAAARLTNPRIATISLLCRHCESEEA